MRDSPVCKLPYAVTLQSQQGIHQTTREVIAAFSEEWIARDFISVVTETNSNFLFQLWHVHDGQVEAM